MSDATKYYPFTKLVDMSPGAIERRIKEVFDLNEMCRHLGEAKPVEPGDHVAEDATRIGSIVSLSISQPITDAMRQPQGQHRHDHRPALGWVCQTVGS